MFPNPQEALPLPQRPSVEQYKKLAKDLVKSCRSDDPAAIRAWAARWMEALFALHREPKRLDQDDAIQAHTDLVEAFARRTLSSREGPSARCTLADAQFVIARSHGFPGWPTFVTHIESLKSATSQASAFEGAVHAIVSGDILTLPRLLREQPGLIRARSNREHQATLLHYVSANGVEGYRQITPKNIVEIAKILLAAGAEIDATANVYGSGCTTLGLVATSAPPAIAGVQIDLIQVLLDHGARMDLRGMAGHRHSLVRACLANGQPEAAKYLVGRGAPLDLPGAAGVGRLDVVRRFFSENGNLNEAATRADMVDGYSLACGYGRADVVEFLLDRGMQVDAELTGHGAGHTGLHVASYHGHLDVVELLLRRGARVDAIDKTWKTPPLLWAVTGWSERSRADAGRYYDVVARLISAGAVVKPDLVEWDSVRRDPRMLATLTGKTL